MVCLHLLCTENLHTQIDTFALSLIILIVRDMAVPVPPWAGSQALYRRATYSSPAEDKQSPETTPLDSTPSSVDYVD